MELGENVLMAMERKDHNQVKRKGKWYAKPKEANTNKSKKSAKRNICCPDMDTYGPKYFISLIDDYSQYIYIYLFHNNNEALSVFKVFKAEVEKQCEKQIKIVRMDRGGEYYGRYTWSLCKLPESLWTEALKTTVYILNRDPTKVVPMTPFELWKGWKLSLRHIRVWGCPYEVRVYNPQEKKLDPKTISAYFIGYAERSKEYRFYYQVVQGSPEIVEQPVKQHDPHENVDTTLKRSTKARKTAIPSDYVVYLQESDYDIGVKNDPETFSQVISWK
ncbi:hypothetical protein AAG906_015927 [Vitis piasezkii]